MNDVVSNERLALVHPALAAKVNAAATVSYFRVAQGVRTYAEQNALPHAVTNAKGGYSWHNFGMAVDCFPFINGFTGPLEMNNHASPVFQAMIAALKAQGLAWGGDWQHFKDYPHFQLAGIPVSPTDADRAAYASGGLQTVWKLYA